MLETIKCNINWEQAEILANYYKDKLRELRHRQQFSINPDKLNNEIDYTRKWYKYYYKLEQQFEEMI